MRVCERLGERRGENLPTCLAVRKKRQDANRYGSRIKDYKDYKNFTTHFREFGKCHIVFCEMGVRFPSVKVF